MTLHNSSVLSVSSVRTCCGSQALVLAITLLILALSMPARAQTTQPAPLQGLGIDQHLNQQLPLDATFRDESGNTVQLRDLLHPHRPVILSLVYFGCPMLCTLVLNDTLSAARALPLDIGKDYDVLTISFDPSETPALAAAKRDRYLRIYNRPSARDGWHFLTGDEANIKKVTEAVGFHYRWDDASKQFFHPAGITILTPEGRIARYFFGIHYDPADIRLSLIEASNNKIGSLTDQLLLFCYHYDPSTGRYNWAVFNLLRIVGALTVLLLGAFMVRLIQIDRTRTRALMPPEQPKEVS